MELRLDIVGERLTDIDFGARDPARVFLGIQKGEEVVDLVPVTADSATFTAQLRVSPLPDGAPNFLGPYAHGPRTARFCYLSWLYDEEDGRMSQFGRTKLPLISLTW